MGFAPVIGVASCSTSNAGLSASGVGSVNSWAGTSVSFAFPTPTKPYFGAFTQMRSPGASRFRELEYHAPPPAEMKPWRIASGQDRDGPCPKDA